MRGRHHSLTLKLEPYIQPRPWCVPVKVSGISVRGSKGRQVARPPPVPYTYLRACVCTRVRLHFQGAALLPGGRRQAGEDKV